MKDFLVKINNISKVFDSNTVIPSFNYTLNRNNIYGFIGKNGAGKTTLFKLLARLSHTSSGNIEFADDTKIGCFIGDSIYPNLTLEKNLRLYKVVLDKDNKTDIPELLQSLELDQYKDKKASELSLGMKQRLSIGISLLGNPNLLVYDEPLNGLDPVNTVTIRKFLKKYCRENNATMIISSHDIGQLSKLAHNFVLINDGELICDFSESHLSNFTPDEYEDLFVTLLKGGSSHVLSVEV